MRSRPQSGYESGRLAGRAPHTGSNEMAKGQIKKNSGNKPKLSVKEKKEKKKEKAALKTR